MSTERLPEAQQTPTTETQERVPLAPVPARFSPIPDGRGPRCTATKKDGTPCRGMAHGPEGLCMVHNPRYAESMRAAQIRGGHAPRPRRRRDLDPIAASAQPIKLETVEDATALLAATMDRLIKGEVDRATANGVAYGVQVFLRAVDVRDLQRRVEALEAAAKAAER